MEKEKAINRKRLGDNTYGAGFRLQSVIIHAVSAPAARQKAIEHFRPKNKERDKIQVELISKD